MSHEMYNAVLLIGDEVTKTLNCRGASTLKRDGIRKRFNTFLQPHPFALDVERVQFMTQWIGRDCNDVQAALQCWRGDALLGRETTHEMALQDEKALGIFRAI